MKLFDVKYSYVKAFFMIFLISISQIQTLQSESFAWNKINSSKVKNHYNVSRNNKYSSNASKNGSVKIEDFNVTEEQIKSIKSGCWLVVGVDKQSTKFVTNSVCDISRRISKVKKNERVFKSRKDTYLISTVEDPKDRNFFEISFDKEDNEDEKIQISDTKITVDELPVNFLKENNDYHLIELPENSVAIYSKHNYLGKRRIIDQDTLKEIKLNEGIKSDINIKSIILSNESVLKITLKSNIKSKYTYLFYNDSSKVHISSIIPLSPESKILN